MNYGSHGNERIKINICKPDFINLCYCVCLLHFVIPETLTSLNESSGLASAGGACIQPRTNRSNGKYPQGQGAAEVSEASLPMVPSVMHSSQQIGRAGMTDMTVCTLHMKLVEMGT